MSERDARAEMGLEPVLSSLREAYDRTARERDQIPIDSWKVEERTAFLERLQACSAKRLLEIGAGPGRDGLFFKECGLDVTCTDLSLEMVARCREKGLQAFVMDYHHLDFPESSFDGVFALNCLLHAPKASLPDILRGIRRILRPGGLLYVGVYGGFESEGVWEHDTYTPKRFFSFYTDEALLDVVASVFDVESFRRIELHDRGDDVHFQSLILRHKQGARAGCAEVNVRES